MQQSERRLPGRLDGLWGHAEHCDYQVAHELCAFQWHEVLSQKTAMFAGGKSPVQCAETRTLV